MTIDGGPPPGDGYPDPSRYKPSDLGTKKVWESSDDQLHLILPVAALRYLDVEQGDKVKFLKGGMEEKTVTARAVKEEDDEQ